MKTVFITGATGGLGQALCRAFLESPCRIGLHTYRKRAEGKRLATQAEAAGCEASLYSADLRDANAIQIMFRQFLKHEGKIDLLINNAAATKDSRLPQISSEAWDNVLALNLSAAFHCMRAVGTAMRENGGGHIINIGSYGAMTGRIGQASYTASKGGLIALTQSAAKEWGKHNIQVNAVCPGYLPTPMTAGLKPADARRLIGENQLGRPATLEEVSDFIRHLSTMQHVSGQTFNLDSRIG